MPVAEQYPNSHVALSAKLSSKFMSAMPLGGIRDGVRVRARVRVWVRCGPRSKGIVPDVFQTWVWKIWKFAP